MSCGKIGIVTLMPHFRRRQVRLSLLAHLRQRRQLRQLLRQRRLSRPVLGPLPSIFGLEVVAAVGSVEERYGGRALGLGKEVSLLVAGGGWSAGLSWESPWQSGIGNYRRVLHKA